METDIIGGDRLTQNQNPYGQVAPSCKLELARFSAQLRIQDGAKCGNTTQDQTELDKSMLVHNNKQYKTIQDPTAKVKK